VAGRIREEDIAEVREKVRIDDVISSYVTLRPAGGGSLKGLCPFHDEKSPSFNVNPARAFYHCFGCGEGGDVISFLMKIDGLSFIESVERLAEKTGIVLRREEDGLPSQADRPRGPQRGRLIEANKIAQEYYADQLRTPDAQVARTFLTERGFDQSAAETFGLGFAPRDGESLLKVLRQRGFKDDESVAAGLVAIGRSAYDRFRGACSGRSGTPAATPSASARGASSTTTGFCLIIRRPPRPRSTRRARCCTASTWPAATWRAARRRSWSRATPT